MRGRYLILASVLAILVPVVAYAVLAPDVYEATTRLYVETGSGGPLEGALLGSSDGFGQDRAISNELYILQNAEDLAESAAAEILRYAETAGGGVLTVLESEDGDRLPASVVAGRLASEYVRVAQDGNGVDAVRVTAKSQSPTEAALIANLYADAYVNRTQSSSRSSVAASREFLEGQADSVAVELAAREEATRSYMDREGAVRLDEEAANTVSQLAALEAERDQVRVEAGMEAARITELRSQIGPLETNLARRLGSGTDRELQQNETRLAALRDRLEAVYLRDAALRDASNVPSDVADLRRQVEGLERRIREASDRLVEESIAAGGVDASTSGLPRLSGLRDRLTEAEVTLSGLRSRARILDGRIASYQADLGRVPEQSLELARLVRERQSAERLALGLDQRLQEARVAESAQLGYAEVVSSAAVPAVPVAPNRVRTVILGLLIGLGIGLVLAIGRAQLDQAVRRPAQLREAGYPVLGVVPNTHDLVKEDFGGAEMVESGGREFSTSLVAMLSPFSPAAEAFRGIRTSVQFARPDAVIGTLLVTSASPGEGKSTVAANLAIVMAQAGRSTLLIDADLRRPRVHKSFGIPRSPGLTDSLTSDERFRAVEVADDLNVLPAGVLVPNPAEHLGSLAFRDLVARFREDYDLVIVDAPPVMAATDAAILSTQVDATVIVASAGSTKSFELEYAAEEIAAVGGQTIGVVLNRFDVTQEYGYRYQYAYRYGREYGYGLDPSDDE